MANTAWITGRMGRESLDPVRKKFDAVKVSEMLMAHPGLNDIVLAKVFQLIMRYTEYRPPESNLKDRAPGRVLFCFGDRFWIKASKR